MIRIGVIAEGRCDHRVLENILLGFFGHSARVNEIQPPPVFSEGDDDQGGWTKVFDCLRRGDAEKALQLNDYVVIHVDADVQDDIGFDVPRRIEGRDLLIAERVQKISERLASCINTECLKMQSARIVYAVAVDSIECWLLPLLLAKKKAEKTTGCLNAANHALRKSKMDGLSSSNGKKFPNSYDEASRKYIKKKVLLQQGKLNPSFQIFIERLEELEVVKSEGPDEEE